MKKGGFTLLEVILVITILAMLAGLLFPVFAGAKKAAKGDVCIANLHSTWTADHLYMADYDDQFPLATDSSNHNVFLWLPDLEEQQSVSNELNHLPALRVLLQSYARSNAIWRCPLDVGAVTDAVYYNSAFHQVSPEIAPSAFQALGTSYAYRVELAFDASGTSANCIADSGQPLASPAELADISGFWHGDVSEVLITHNVAFTDGHAKSVGRDAFLGSWLCGLG